MRSFGLQLRKTDVLIDIIKKQGLIFHFDTNDSEIWPHFSFHYLSLSIAVGTYFCYLPLLNNCREAFCYFQSLFRFHTLFVCHLLFFGCGFQFFGHSRLKKNKNDVIHAFSWVPNLSYPWCHKDKLTDFLNLLWLLTYFWGFYLQLLLLLMCRYFIINVVCYLLLNFILFFFYA